MDLDGFVAGWAILGGIGVGKARPGGVVAVFDGVKPGGLDGKAGGGVEVADEGAHAVEVVVVEGVQSCRVSGNDVWWTGVGVIFGAEIETHSLAPVGSCQPLKSMLCSSLEKTVTAYLSKRTLQPL